MGIIPRPLCLRILVHRALPLACDVHNLAHVHVRPNLQPFRLKIAIQCLPKFVRRRLPGLTGDIYGAGCEIVELVVLLAFVAREKP